MKDKHKQLSMIVSFLEEDKKKEVANLALIKMMLDKKIESINRIIAYRSDYEKIDSTSMMRVVPSLIKNMNEFMKKLDGAIDSEKSALDIIEREKIQAIKRIDTIDSKINAIVKKIDQINFDHKVKEENIEANNFDEFNAHASVRDKQ